MFCLSQVAFCTRLTPSVASRWQHVSAFYSSMRLPHCSIGELGTIHCTVEYLSKMFYVKIIIMFLNIALHINMTC